MAKAGLSPLQKVSVIVPHYGPIEAARRCIEAILAAEPKPWEVIVVLDGRASGSLEWLEGSGVKVLELPSRAGPAKARNAGAASASGELLFFVDSDVVVPPRAVEQVQRTFTERPGLSALFGSYDDGPQEPNFLSQYRNLLHHHVHQNAQECASTFWSGCGAIRRDIFESLGGFDEGYSQPSIEDIELGVRLVVAGHSIQLCKALQVKHLKRWDFVSMMRTDFLQRGLPWSALILRHRKMPDDLNVTWAQRASVLVSLGGILSLGLMVWWWGFRVSAGGCVAALIVLNAPFYRFLWRKRGVWFCLRAMPLHWLMFLLSGAAFATAVARWLFTGGSMMPSAGAGPLPRIS